MPTSRINEQHKCRISDSLLSVIPSFLDGESFSNSSLVKYQEYMCSHDNFSMLLDPPSIRMLEKPAGENSTTSPVSFRGSSRRNSWLFVCILDFTSILLSNLQNHDIYTGKNAMTMTYINVMCSREKTITNVIQINMNI